MRWNEHYRLAGRHSFLSASQHSWLNYDVGKVLERYDNSKAKEKGTKLHEFAENAIKLRVRLDNTVGNKALANFVNDAIGFKMQPEVLLYYSDYAFGTADAIRYDPPSKANANGKLRIHDLKTGAGKVKIKQLVIYAAYFFIEYQVKPERTDIELRIYQKDDILVYVPDVEEIQAIIRKIKEFSSVLENRPKEDLL